MESILIVTGIIVAAVLVYLYVIRKNRDGESEVTDIYIDEPVDEAVIVTDFDEVQVDEVQSEPVQTKTIIKNDELLS
jgi:uncharacterized membrane protein